MRLRSPPMESSIGKLLYWCISKHDRILYSYSGGDRDLETLAALCIEKTLPFHSHYFHTDGGRTFGFLIDDALTCFTIVDHQPPDSKPPSKRKILQLLQQIKNGYKKRSSSNNNNLGDDLVPVIKRLICSLESMNHSNSPTSGGYGAADVSTSTRAPLLGRSGSGERKISSSVKIDVAGGGAARQRAMPGAAPAGFLDVAEKLEPFDQELADREEAVVEPRCFHVFGSVWDLVGCLQRI